jgi:membrane protease YdiL (CAAX protease family)
MSSRALALFLGSLVLATWGVQAAALIVVGDPESEAMTPWLLGSMFMPSLWSLAYLTLFNRKAWKLVRFWPGNPVYLALAALIPAAIAFAVLAAVSQLGWGASSFFSFAPGGADVLRGPWTLGAGAQGWALFAANVAVTALVFAGVNGVVAVGEEFGWRGLLQHHMIARLGFLRGVALLGFIWAIWHAPLNLAGYNHPDNPVLGALVLFPIQLIAESFILAWLTIRARSFWPAALMHGSGNGIQEGVMSSLTLNAGVAPLSAELLMLGVTIALALVCIALTPRPQRDQDAAAARPIPA